MLRTPLTQMLDLRAPIIGAPMAGVAGGELAAAVSKAGGLGMIGIGGASSPRFILDQAAIPAEAGLPFGIGLMAWAIERRPELLDATLEARPSLVSVSFGSPRPYMDRLRAAGVLVATQVNSLADTREALAAGVDLLVAQGGEAGGHTGRRASLPLLQEVLEVSDVPVLAAGGIATGRGLAAVLAAGAAGAWVGTALLACPEGLNAPGARQQVLAAGGDETIYTSVFDIAQGIPWPARYGARALRNMFTERWHGREQELRASDTAGQALADGIAEGDYDVVYVYAGEAVGLIRAERPAAEVVDGLAVEAERVLRQELRDLLA